MKNMIRTTLAMAALLVAAPLAAQQPTARIVFINSQQIMQEAPTLQAARERIQGEIQALEEQARQELNPLNEQVQQMLTTYQQQRQMLTPEKRREQEAAIQAKQQELQQRAAQWDQRAQERQQQLLEPVLERVNTTIERLREEKGYAFILDVAAGGVIAADPSLDVTGEVLQRLQASGENDG